MCENPRFKLGKAKFGKDKVEELDTIRIKKQKTNKIVKKDYLCKCAKKLVPSVRFELTTFACLNYTPSVYSSARRSPGLSYDGTEKLLFLF